MIFVQVVMAIVIAAMMAMMPVMTSLQIAKAYVDCSRPVTQEDRYVCGYNRGYLDAHRDWNLHRFPPESGRDNSCPHAKKHTPEYCNGYQIGYTTYWNARLNQGPNPPTNYTIPPNTAPTLTPTKFLKYRHTTSPILAMKHYKIRLSLIHLHLDLLTLIPR
jgi:hypothetical protein